MDPPQRDMSLSGAPPSRGPWVSCQQCHCARQENEERQSIVGTWVLRMSSVWCSDRILRSLREVRDSGIIFHWRFKNNKYNQDKTPELRSTTPTPSSPWVTVGARGLTEAFAIPKGSRAHGEPGESPSSTQPQGNRVSSACSKSPGQTPRQTSSIRWAAGWTQERGSGRGWLRRLRQPLAAVRQPEWFFQQQQSGWYCRIFAGTKPPAEKAWLCMFSVNALDLIITSQDNSLSPQSGPSAAVPTQRTLQPGRHLDSGGSLLWLACGLSAPGTTRSAWSPCIRGSEPTLPTEHAGGWSRPGTCTFLIHLWVLNCFGTEWAAQSCGHLLLTPLVSSSP